MALTGGLAAPIPVGVVTGFLGSGKTTFINRLLRDPALAETMVVVNEFGEIGLDHLLIERAEGDVILLASGCLCCSLRSDLVDALQGVLARRDEGRVAFSRILLETSGLADPAPALQAIGAATSLATSLRLGSVVTLIDAVNGAATLTRYLESQRQPALADRLIVSKGDLIGSGDQEKLGELHRAVRRFNAHAPIGDSREEFSAGDFFAIDCPNAGGEPADRSPWRFPGRVATDGGHDQAFIARSLRSSTPIAPQALEAFFHLLRAPTGPRLLRVKGLIATVDNPAEPLLVQSVKHILHPARRLSHWPNGDLATRVIFVGEAKARVAIEQLWATLTGAPMIDSPDHAAIFDNPLALSRGGGLFER
jgi:G3E family GTPase